MILCLHYFPVRPLKILRGPDKILPGLFGNDELGKKIQRIIKDSKMKVQAAIQDGKLRVSGTKRDDLQAAMALIKKEVPDMPLSFDNFRD